MTTKAILKSRIADDLARSNLTTQIGEAIDDAIAYYQNEERFYFTEKRSATFATVVDQSDYTESDDADIGLLLKVDRFFIEESSQRHIVTLWHPDEIELLLDNSAGKGRPYAYSFYNETIRLYPIPDQVFTVRPMGEFVIAGPATDDEADNPWMTKAFSLIRYRAENQLYLHVIKNTDQAAIAEREEKKALKSLRTRANRMYASGTIEKTDF